LWYTGSKGDKASEDTHEEAREKLSAPEKPEDMRAPSSIREYDSLNYACEH